MTDNACATKRSSDPDPAPVIGELRSLLGDRIKTDEDIRESHAGDASYHKPMLPDAVVFPECNGEVSKIVKLCARYRTPVVPYGTGTAVEGGIVAVRGGVCIDLSRMKRVLRIGEADLDATVEAGVTRKQLNRHLEEAFTGLYFPVDPGADASLGGMAATRASGSAAVGYGTMRENVLGLTAILADGSIIQAGGRARKSSAGYDLAHLFVGSEGTLGVITEVTLRLARVPDAVSAAVCAFPDISSAVDAVLEMTSAGIEMARIELLDDVQMGAINAYSGFDYRVAPTLFFEFHGSESSVAERVAAARPVADRHGGEDFRRANGQRERDRLWQARYDAYYASQTMRPGSVGYVTDVCVPVSRLADCIHRTKKELKASTLIAPLFGHVGDGNFHVVFLIDPDRPEELAEAREFGERIVEFALEMGGTCTGEHGIGMGKLAALEQEHGEGVKVMRAIKKALDPHNIMNPGKVVEI
ncbi:MAG: FAD-binding protein [Gemmatimonadota bacterium]|nr:FAD-binding protein [Gemmatimonadota bacterium]